LRDLKKIILVTLSETVISMKNDWKRIFSFTKGAKQ